MASTLRGLSVVVGLFLLAVSAWITFRYAAPVALVIGLASAGGIVGLPMGVPHAKIIVRRVWRSVRDRARDGIPDRQRTLVSETPVEDPAAALAAIADAVTDAEEFDDVRHEEFEDGGDGLMVIHAGFHGSFVRITDGGRLAVTGASRRTRSLAQLIEKVRPLSMTARPNNPFHAPSPVYGPPRVFLVAFMIAVAIAAAGSMMGAAYPVDHYTADEKAVMVVMDFRADVDGDVSPTRARLDKARFIVSTVNEEAIEVNWKASKRSTRVRKHGRQALAMGADARDLLATVRASDPTPGQAARADRIEADLRAAETRVATGITRRMENDDIERTEALEAIVEALRTDPDERDW